MYIAPPLYFLRKDAAIHYYRHWEDADDIVKYKMSIGELLIGKPTIKSGERLVVVEGRYAIVEERANGTAKRNG
jgi:hypothetical protein